MKVTLNEKAKTITIEMDATLPPAPSASGKMNIIATTHGFTGCDAVYKGKPVKVSINIGVSNK